APGALEADEGLIEQEVRGRIAELGAQGAAAEPFDQPGEPVLLVEEPDAPLRVGQLAPAAAAVLGFGQGRREQEHDGEHRRGAHGSKVAIWRSARPAVTRAETAATMGPVAHRGWLLLVVLATGCTCGGPPLIPREDGSTGDPDMD